MLASGGLLLTIILGAWFWHDSLRAKELAVRAGQCHCEKHGLQLLDDTAALRHIRLVRADSGKLCLLRVYRFEYFDQYLGRGKSNISVRGKYIADISLPVSNNVVDFDAFRAAREERQRH